MKKSKYIFIALVVFSVAAGFYLYTSRHGVADTVGNDVGVSAGQAILIDGNTGKVIYEKNVDEKAYPASTTKIMTALITIETLEKHDSPIEQKIKVPQIAEGVEGSSLYLKAGEEISVEDLLYGLMLVSGNDAATALAEIIGGSQENFVKMMNDRAAEIGCSNTHFANPSGLFDAMKALGSTRAVFCGHDHYNNFSIDYKGIRLTYGMSVDYLAYPGIYKIGSQRGCTVINFAPDGSFECSQESYYQDKYESLYDKESVEMQEITQVVPEAE